LDPLTIAQIAIGGLLLGAVYALLACGLNLIFGVMRVINVSHGQLMMLGSYATLWVFTSYGALPFLAPILSSPIPFIVVSVVVSMAVMFVVGVFLQRFFVQYVMRAPELTSLLLTFGLGITITNLALYFWSANYQSVPYLTGSFALGPLSLSLPRLVAFSFALVITLVVYFFLQRARFGKAIRATAQHGDMAMICGIDVGRVRLITFGLGAALAGAAGSLLITMYAVNPDMGQVFILKAFAIIVLGGMGSFSGAFLGALILGLVEGFTSYFFTVQLSEAAAYIILILVLLLKPSGLLGLRE